MDETNFQLNEEMQNVVKNQMRQNDPPETKQTFDRLIIEGFSEDEAMRQLGQVVAAEIFDVMKSNKPFNQERYIERLKNLPLKPE